MKIKWILLFLCTLCLVKTTCGQSDLKISQSDNLRLVQVLNNSDLIVENREKGISVRIYAIDNGSGSAGFESGEVSHNLLIAVSEFDEYPNQNVFEIGPFYDPTFVQWIGEMEYLKGFEIEYGAYDDRKSLKLQVDINKLKMD
jgi:hypothetical protein